jgi:hypothetical protein
MSLVAIAAFAASTIVPAQPTSFETVNLRMTLDSCGFDPSSVRVTLQSNVFRVHQDRALCSPPGPTVVADVRLGSLPAGDYFVERYDFPGLPTEFELLSFQVRDPVVAAVFPPIPRPLTDYSGLWIDMSNVGWGVSLLQGPLHNVFGLIFVYDANRQPEWYSLQSGRWTSSTIWTATVYRTTGPAFASGSVGAPVSYNVAGTAGLDFSQVPGREGRATFTYTINGQSGTRTVERMPLM